MIKKTFYRTLRTHDPYEPPETVSVYETLDLIPENSEVVQFLREANDYDKIKHGSKTVYIYQNIHTGEEVPADWTGPDCLYVEPIEVICKS